MPIEILFILALPALVVTGMILQFLRARRRGLRGRSAFIAIFKPVSIWMQGEAAMRGLPASRLEVVDAPTGDDRSSSQSQ
jgi:hypothetical protein